MAWLSSWSHRKTVTITGQSGAGTDYQVNLSIGDASGGDFHLENHCTSFPNDITITDNDQTTLLDHWVEDLTVDPISMWVEVADDLGSNADVCIYYRKSGASTASDITTTFPLADHFTGSSLDTSKWDSSGTITVTNSEVSLNEDDAIISKLKFGLGYAVHARSKADEQDSAFVTFRENLASGNNLHNLANSDAGIPEDNFDNFQIYSDKGGTNNTHYEDNWNDFRNTYYIYRIKRISTTKVIFEQEANSWTETDSSYISTVDLGACLRVWDSSQASTLICDWIFIKKYNDPEPAFSSAGSEESAGGRLVYGGLVNAGLVGGRLA